MGRPLVKVESEGEYRSIAEWARVKKIGYHTLYARLITEGWNTEKALNTPVRAKRNLY